MPGYNPVGNVMRLIIAKILKIFLIDVSFAILSDNFDILKVEFGLSFVLPNPIYKNSAFVFTPKKRKKFINNIGLKIFAHIS